LGEVHDLADAILHAVIYADLFDYPLTDAQIHRYLPAWNATLSDVQRCLAEDPRLGTKLDSAHPFWFLSGRDHLVALRRQREAFSVLLWRSARRYARLIATLPFVEMVAVTGSLAVNNPRSAQDDIDFLIVSRRNRVWFVRGQVVLLVRLASSLGVHLCPNYVIASHVLDFGPSTLFSAHELAQLVPLYGRALYSRILQSNPWVSSYLPNAHANGTTSQNIGSLTRTGKKALEAAFNGHPGDWLERWEQRRKIPKLVGEAASRGGSGARFTPDICKGHMDDHGTVVLGKLARSLAAHGL
jgi:hypothetical protein